MIPAGIGIIAAIGTIIRAEYVGKARNRIVDYISECNKELSNKGDEYLKAMTLFDVLDEVSFNTMVHKFWIPIKKFEQDMIAKINAKMKIILQQIKKESKNNINLCDTCKHCITLKLNRFNGFIVNKCEAFNMNIDGMGYIICPKYKKTTKKK